MNVLSLNRVFLLFLKNTFFGQIICWGKTYLWRKLIVAEKYSENLTEISSLFPEESFPQ